MNRLFGSGFLLYNYLSRQDKGRFLLLDYLLRQVQGWVVVQELMSGLGRNFFSLLEVVIHLLCGRVTTLPLGRLSFLEGRLLRKGLILRLKDVALLL